MILFFFSVSSGKLLIIIIIDDAVITILDSHLYLWILEKKAFSIGQPLSRDAKKLELILEQGPSINHVVS